MQLTLGPLDFLLSALRPEKVQPTETLGVSGTPAYGGWLVTNERSPSLVGRKKYETYSNILANTSIVGAGVRYFLNLVSKSPWRVEPADGSGADGELACQLVEDMIDRLDTPWYRVVRRAAMYKFFGYSAAEWTAAIDEEDPSRILIADVESRPQITLERWDIDQQGHIAGILQRAPRDQRIIYLPRAKLVYCVDDALDDSPEGLGLFRHLAEPARKLDRYQELEGIGLEGDLRGIPVIKAPLTLLEKLKASGKLTHEQIQAILNPFRSFLTNHVKSASLGMMIDSQPYTSLDAAASPSVVQQWDVEVNKGGGVNSGQQEIGAAIERLNREMARVIGVEQLLLGSGSSGSHALSRDKTNNFALTVDSTLAEMRQTFRRDLVLPLLKMNGLDESAAPEFKNEATAYRDVEQVTNALFQLAQAGAPLQPNDPAINEIRDILGLTDAPEQIAVMDPNLPPQPGMPVKRKPGTPAPGVVGAPPGKTPAAPRPGETTPMKGDQGKATGNAGRPGAAGNSSKNS